MEIFIVTADARSVGGRERKRGGPGRMGSTAWRGERGHQEVGRRGREERRLNMSPFPGLSLVLPSSSVPPPPLTNNPMVWGPAAGPAE